MEYGVEHLQPVVGRAIGSGTELKMYSIASTAYIPFYRLGSMRFGAMHITTINARYNEVTLVANILYVIASR